MECTHERPLDDRLCHRYFSLPFLVRGGGPVLRAALPVQDAEAEARGGGAADGGLARYATNARAPLCDGERAGDRPHRRSRPPKDSLLPGYQKQTHHDSIIWLQNHNQEVWRRCGQNATFRGVGGAVLVVVVPQW